MPNRYPVLIALLLAVTALAASGALLVDTEWYGRLPTFGLAPWAIVVAWALCHVALAVGAWLALDSGAPGTRALMVAWIVLLVLLAVWNFVLFSLHRTGWALPLIGLAVGTSLYVAWIGWRCNRLAGELLLACSAWLAMNALWLLAVWQLSRTAGI